MIADLIDRVISADPDLQHCYDTSPEVHAVLYRARHMGDERAVEELVRAVAASARLHDGAAMLARAVHVAGPMPAVHHEIAARHRREWPSLWRAIDVVTGRRCGG